ncbi:uncharacterized protein B0P05DRAFT_135366 [Gilbertella persicaria]|uniref:uncharacterized protein n=1 Tax=Gilbertella persicaria TaxID=101096 RepID=UPI0022204B4F|nr:uncharacterized protein B0P05DRAFT_135366 [Gilbertella persicaria]KAI8076679.1 hypothetical protein B0P05DRAFT_135366 [Gilbertella persicaria]
MFFSYLSRLFKQISKSRWIQFYFALVIVSTILTVSILIKTLANTNRINQNQEAEAIDDNYEFSVYLTAKGYKIVYENILFIVFEVWRIWCLTDGIVHLNSLTILASAWLSIFSVLFNLLVRYKGKEIN